VDDGGVAHADSEAELVDGDAEETEIEENPEIVAGPTDAAGASGVGKGGETQAKKIDEEHEDAGEDEAERGEGEWVHVAESDFGGDVVEGPDDDKEGDGGREYTAGGRLGGGGVEGHGNGWEYYTWGEGEESLQFTVYS